MTPEEQAQVDAELKKAVDAAVAESKAYWQGELREVVTARDEAKRKLKEREDAEQKAAQDKLLEEGKLRELLTAKEKELEGLQDLKSRVAKYEEAEKSQREAEAKRKEALLAKLPEEKRKLYSDVPLSALEDVVTTLTAPDPTKVVKPGGTGDPNLYTMEQIKAMSQAEVQANLEKVNKSLATLK